jgi:hypothetical protein
VRAIQRTQFRAKNAKNNLNPTYLMKRNFCFETEGVRNKNVGHVVKIESVLYRNMSACHTRGCAYNVLPL